MRHKNIGFTISFFMEVNLLKLPKSQSTFEK